MSANNKNINLKKLHYVAGMVILVFIVLHLGNHLLALFGAGKHIAVMDSLRIIYRNPVSETILLAAVGVQVVSGIKLFIRRRKLSKTLFERIQIWSGLYLAVFLFIHLGAVLSGRYLLHLDTNYYFGAAGLNSFPHNLFFFPYYALAMLSFFGHMAAVHHQKMKHTLLGASPHKQSVILLIFGVIITCLVLCGMTNGFRWIDIPKEYHILIGR